MTGQPDALAAASPRPRDVGRPSKRHELLAGVGVAHRRGLGDRLLDAGGAVAQDLAQDLPQLLNCACSVRGLLAPPSVGAAAADVRNGCSMIPVTSSIARSSLPRRAAHFLQKRSVRSRSFFT